MDVVIVSLLGAVFLLVAGMAWRVPRAIHESADATNAKNDATARDLSAKIDVTARDLSAKIDNTNAKIDATARDLGAKIDATARDLGAKIDDTNAIVSDIRERVAYLEGRADPPTRAA